VICFFSVIEAIMARVQDGNVPQDLQRSEV
jgi:hypothetical protein